MADEDMLPPPRREQLSTNADFRKLLETPRAERFADTPRRSKPRSSSTADAPKPKQKKPYRPKPEPEKKEDEGPSYRDRAEERRKGVNPDYERLADDFAGLSGDNLHSDLNHISVEDSKYLGGDVDHTHLVKGLDYALLQKVRGEITKDEPEEKTEAGGKRAAREPEIVKFKSAAGRAIFNAIFTRPKVRSGEFFLPGRTAFVYDLDGSFAPEVPMTLRRSKADCPVVVETVKGGMDTSVLERMVKIMSYMRGTSGKPGKLKKKDKLRMLQMMEGVAVNGSAKAVEAKETRNGPADAEADIFGDAGRDYVPELPSKSRRANGGARSANGAEPDEGALPPPPPPPRLPDAGVGPAKPSGGYDSAAAAYAAYGDGGDEAPAPPPPPPPPLPDQDAEDLELDRLAGLAPADEPEPKPAKPPRATEAEIIRKDTEDAYEECYPDYGGFNAAVVDSDEEDLTHMDSKEGKSRYDFNTEEQWEKYKGSKEMMPKAAFQFGVKMSDGRRGHKQLGKAVEQKEQKQLRQIQGMLKKDHGEQYAPAFRDPKPDQESGQAPSKRRRI